MDSPVDIVRRFRGLRVLLLGDAMLDSYFEGSATRLCSEGPVPVVRKTAEEHVPGGAANTAANLRALGADVTFVALVGRDPAAALLRTGLERQGVDGHWLVEDDRVSTLHKQRILSDEQYVVRFDAGDTREPSAGAKEQLITKLASAFDHCDLVVISDYRYGTVTEELVDQIVKLRRRQRDCPLIVDSKNLVLFGKAHATLITPNAFEAQLLVEGNSTDEDEIDVERLEDIGRQLLQLIDADHVAITMDQKGALLLSRAGPVTRLPAHPVQRSNDVGAGDSFTAAIALALGAGARAEEAARIAIYAGSIAVSQRRTAVVEHQELLQRVSLEDHLRGQSQTAPTPQVLARLLERERESGKTIVFTNGVFDILHAGHVHFLREARALGDVLVVGVNSDASARRLKGKNRPINSSGDRLALVAALDSVDHAVLFDEHTPAALIRALRPDVHVKGGDYAGEALPEAQAVEEIGGRVVILPLVQSLSTSSMIDRIVALALEDGRKVKA